MNTLTEDLGRVFGSLERLIAKEKGEFTLFALLEREDLPDQWDLVVSAPWFGSNYKETVDYFTDQIQLHLGSAVLVALSRLVVLNPSDPRIQAITGSIPAVEHGEVELRDRQLFGADFRHAIVITSRAQDRAA